ncbi:MAG: response regulator [Thermodesulfobacteriota bacterium]
MKAKKILAVDDEPHLRFFLAALFETAGYPITIAKDGREGLRRARENKPDLIILDLMMPGEGGVPMYRQLKTDETLKRIPVIVLSGVAGRTFAHSLKMLSLGLETPLPEPEAYMEKPPRPEKLLTLAKNLLGDQL